MRFAQVALPIPKHTLFTYALPAGMSVEPGSLVLVPTGRTHQTGVVWELTDEPAWKEGKILEIAATLGELPLLGADLLHLLDWISRYYLCSLGSVAAAALPGELSYQRKRRAIWRAEADPETIPPALLPLATKIRQRKDGLSEETLASHFGKKGLIERLKELEKRALIRLETTWSARLPEESAPAEPDEPWSALPPPTLTEEQNLCVQRLHQALQEKRFAPFLLEGITGSGKTEVYLRAIESGLRLGRQALVLVPEISLTSQMIARLRARFPATLAVLHSGLTRTQRPKEWWRIRKGEARVAVGARSALFAPFADLGLLIVDEEHDPSYKQEGSVPYQARDMAAVRAQKCGAVLILGSATPSMESLANVERGRYGHLRLTRRAGGGHVPRVEAILLSDPALQRLMGKDGLISPPLRQAMSDTLNANRQILLFLNRRGFAPSLLCHRCGQAIQCPNCSVTLTLHKNRSRLLCHYCDFSRDPMDICPSCGQLSLYHFGPGTQRLEEETRSLFPQARIARLDRDAVTSGVHTLEETLTAFHARQIDILVGTQMTAKGHHFPGLSLVGVVQAETTLCQPDFRAAERTFQILTQVAGRAGREDQSGLAIIQTLDPNHYAVAAALGRTPDFARQEMAFRRQAGYPPFRRLAMMRISTPLKPDGELFCQMLKAALIPSVEVECLGPAPAPLFKLRNRHRWQLLIKEREGGRLHRALSGILSLAESMAGHRIRLEIDVDPQLFL
ncbi:MAG: primosomal protein N' [Magnetococcales bacterium]|nr:primosomal protein N' [Magnetococcales bacterium]